MGLTKSSTGKGAYDMFSPIKNEDGTLRVALAGNPNVGKSTIFNELTGMHQHTGNWPGKTVTGAVGSYTYKGTHVSLVDLPGCYSLMANSKEEEVARDFLCFGEPDAVIVVCDATCLERNLNLVLQTIEITSKTVVCVNLMDEAKKKGIKINEKELERLLGVPVVFTAAREGKGLSKLTDAVLSVAKRKNKPSSLKLYDTHTEHAISMIEENLKGVFNDSCIKRWTAVRLLEGNENAVATILAHVETDVSKHARESVLKAHFYLKENGIETERIEDVIVSSIVKKGEEIANKVVSFQNESYNEQDRKIDRVLTGKWGFFVMALLLFFVFWLTIIGSNVPSQMLNRALFQTEEWLYDFCVWLNVPYFVREMLVHGAYRMLIWVVSVMLPPMAIFFPLFTLLEDAGYLPRVAFNLDKCFKRCSACGKQALTMCMGFGCNAAGIIGARIIDSPRERLIAILTNNFVPCNGRFPTLILMITMFFMTGTSGMFQTAGSAVILLLIIMLGILMTFLSSKLLSVTVLKGVPSSFTLELPPYRRPQIGKVLVRSVFDRTLFVLGRAALVSAPAGLIIWLLANITIGGETLLFLSSQFLDPFGKLLGMDGIILMAFILGFPANETVIPIMLMAYLSGGSLTEMQSNTELFSVLSQNGWTYLTAINVILFSLMHWPCSTTMMTIKKETGSVKWTLIAFFLPTLIGIASCFLLTALTRFVSLIL